MAYTDTKLWPSYSDEVQGGGEARTELYIDVLRGSIGASQRRNSLEAASRMPGSAWQQAGRGTEDQSGWSF